MTNLLFAVAASAAAVSLPPVVVEASRTDRAPLEMPASVHVVGEGEISSSAAHDAVDLLSKVAPELHVHRLGAGNPALAEFSLRGYGESGHGRTLVLVDGERLNAPDMNRPNLSRIPLDGVSKIEILGGSQNVLQGDGASAGVINFVTEPADDMRRSYVEFRGGSWGTLGAALGTRGGFADEGLRYWADASWDRSDGYRSHSGYELWNANAGLRKSWSDRASLRVSAFYADAQYDLPGALTWEEWQRDPRGSKAAEDRYHRATAGFNATFRVQLNAENALRFVQTLSSRRMWAYQQGESYGAKWYSDGDYDLLSDRSLLEWLNSTSLFGRERESVVGVQHAVDFMKEWSDSGYGGSKADHSRQTMDFYAQETFHCTDCFALQLGGRYSRTWSYNERSTPDWKNVHLGAFDVALIARPAETAKVYAKLSRTYRNPFLDEVPYDIRTWTPAGLLDPEKGWSAEVGGRWEPTDEFFVDVDAYCSWLEDEIFYDPVAGNNVNAEDRTVRRGVDVRLGWEREKVCGVSAGASFVKATFDGGTFGRNAIPLVPEATVSVNGRVWLWNECFVFGGYRFQSDMYSCSDFANDADTLSWFGVFHVGVTYEPTFLEGLRISAVVDNLFDERYCDFSTYGTQYYPAAGRSFAVTVRYAF